MTYLYDSLYAACNIRVANIDNSKSKYYVSHVSVLSRVKFDYRRNLNRLPYDCDAMVFTFSNYFRYEC